MARRVLIVDDDPHIREVLVFAFDKAGIATTQAGDGQEALALIGRDPPDLVVLDINMPRMDGLEVCRRLRASGDLPILFLSSRDDELDRVLGIELGADDYVVKPFSPREVVARAPADYGVARIGHEGAFRKGLEPLWDEMFDWLIEPSAVAPS
jgi:two-component system OmpR family response regulator